jgi:hypothetical protein
VRYKLDAYIYAPPQLELSSESYETARFIEDLHSHTRHTAPHIPFRELLDPESAISPFARIREAMAEADTPYGLDAARVHHELRMLASAFRAQTRSRRRLLIAWLQGGVEEGGRKTWEKVRPLLRDIRRFREAFDGLAPLFDRDGIPVELGQARRWADEWISLIAEEESLGVLQILHGEGGKEEQAARKALTKLIARETRHRRREGYASVVDPADPEANERMLYHASMLKKWAQGALYMSSEASNAPRNIGHVIAAIAAATAMSFAIVATFLAERFFASYSVPWALLVVVGYMFKDRIKETLRGLLSGVFPRLFFDRAGRLLDPAANRPVGTSQEVVEFTNENEVPAEISAVRACSKNPFRPMLPREDVIHYTKRIKLRAARLQRRHSRLGSITEIFRINVDRWVRQMDDPVSVRSYLEKGRLVQIKARRIYHLHMILALTGPGGGEGPSFFHYRILARRNGIHRIEPAPTPWDAQGTEAG